MQENNHTAQDRFAAFRVEPHAGSAIKRVIAVVSGKGGVGKSMVTGLLASALQRQGYKVGILDADITGPSMPHCFGVGEKAVAVADGLLPVKTERGIKMISMNLLLDHEETPVVWRGPVIGNVVKQFWSEVKWGELDFLLMDLPPGTGDVPLSLFQMIRMDGIIVVSSPQSLVSMIVRKAVKMAEMMNVPVLGVVENYSYIKCPDCGHEMPLFGDSHIAEICDMEGTELLARLPLDPHLAALSDEGLIEDADPAVVEPVVRRLLEVPVRPEYKPLEVL